MNSAPGLGAFFCCAFSCGAADSVATARIRPTARPASPRPAAAGLEGSKRSAGRTGIPDLSRGAEVLIGGAGIGETALLTDTVALASVQSSTRVIDVRREKAETVPATAAGAQIMLRYARPPAPTSATGTPTGHAYRVLI